MTAAEYLAEARRATADLRERLRPASTRLRRALAVTARLAEHGDADAQFTLGQRYLAGDGVVPSRSEAAQWFRAAAEQEHIEAQQMLAAMSLDRRLAKMPSDAKGADSLSLFETDRPAPPDFIEAAYWSARAARKGSSDAQATLAFILSAGPPELRDLGRSALLYRASAAARSPKGMLGHALALFRDGTPTPNFPEIIANLRAAAEAGLADALYLLGIASAEGLGGEVNPADAARWFSQAAAKGHRAAQARWGTMLIQGNGVGADPVLGESWLRRAAIAGDLEAAARIGDLYCRSQGTVPPNLIEASRWYRMAAEGGHGGAASMLGKLLLDGWGVGQDRQQAIAWLLRAVEAGDTAAQALLGNLALEGGLPRADQRALYTSFAVQAHAGGAMAAFNLALCLHEGIGTARDETAAVHWLQAASGEIPLARFHYGRALIEGRGTQRDPVHGRHWLESAAAAGLPDAHEYLARLDGRRSVASAIAAVRNAVPSADEPGRTASPTEAPDVRDAGPTQTGEVLPIGYASPSCGCGSGLPGHDCCDVDPNVPTRTHDPKVRTIIQAAHDFVAAEDLGRAEALCRQALSLSPRDTEALALFYDVRKALGVVEGLSTLLLRIVTLDANNVSATQDLATALFAKGDLAGAEHYARNAIRLAPYHPRSHAVFGMILTETQRSQLGEVHYRRAMALSPQSDPILLANLAWNLKGQSRFDEARALYAESVETASGVFQTWLGWGQLEEADGRFEAAAERLERAASIQPDDPDLAIARARLLSRQGHHEAALAELSRAEAAGRDDPDPNLLLERGRLLDTLSRYDEAFTAFAEGKRIAREVAGKGYAQEQAAESAAELKLFFVRNRVALLPPPQERPDQAQPIFILGFPRSGTTLLEQMVTSHPEIGAGDELPFINELIDELPRVLSSPLPYPNALAELWMADNRLGLQMLAESYLRKAELYGLTTPGARFFTDKMPLNEAHLGFIGAIFPRAPLLHLIRHPLDVVLSVFSHHMTHGHFCAYDLTTIARHYALVMDLVDHYRAEMSLNYLAVRYEALVDDPRSVIGAVLDHIGVAFDTRCLAFQDNRRVPQTPSYAQVRQGLYGQSKGRYHNYRKHLGPVVDILGPTIRRLGYEVD